MTEQRPIGYWLKVVDRLLEEQFAATLDEHGVTKRQWQLLNVLSTGPSTVHNLDLAIAPFLSARPAQDGVSNGSVESSMEHLAELIESAWVEIDGESIRLTERGLGAFERLSSVVAEQRTVVTQGVTEAEYVSTIEVLQRIAINLGYAQP
ncbi:MAG: MarR family transcriptional regulator [Microbacteriaceae bacterium]